MHLYKIYWSENYSRKKKIVFHSKDVIFYKTSTSFENLGKIHNQERSYQSSDDVYKVEDHEFIMQFQEKGEYSTIEYAR
jgi:hypothetical protein